jgi:predicted nucleotide-binding protein
MARPTKAKARGHLRRALDAIPALKPAQSNSMEFEQWKRDTRVAIGRIFGEASSHVTEFINIFDASLLFDDTQEEHVQDLGSASALLKSMIDEIEDWENDNETQIPSSAQGNDRPSSNKVFVIHGRDEGARETVARFLPTLGLEPVILQEQVNQGRTIIEKCEYHADARFAVALLTPDDAGSLQGDKNDLKPRARQNVIFELGFFIGRLGREGVCALTKGDMEIPSDYAGVAYIPLDVSDG